MIINRSNPRLFAASLSVAIALAAAIAPTANGIGQPVALFAGERVSDVQVENGSIFALSGANDVVRFNTNDGSNSSVYQFSNGRSFIGGFAVGAGRLAVEVNTLVARNTGIRQTVLVSEQPGQQFRTVASSVSGWRSKYFECGAFTALLDMDDEGQLLYAAGRSSPSFRRCNTKRLRPSSRLVVNPPSTDPRFPAPSRVVYRSKQSAIAVDGSIDGRWVVNSSGLFDAHQLIDQQSGARTTLKNQGLWGGYQLPGEGAVLAVTKRGNAQVNLPATISVDPFASAGSPIDPAMWDSDFLVCGTRLLEVRNGIGRSSAWIRIIANPLTGSAAEGYVVAPTSRTIRNAACDRNWLAFTSGSDGTSDGPAFAVDLR